ncbi:myrosinase 1-like [Zerene cesonia]|uniref:myrosinase 1-like n=1 Tax=Zerene cesonia TaxID=33412 RepID=UPI0018E590F8|nr:myrosinase 1-like [Zerene cesonia]
MRNSVIMLVCLLTTFSVLHFPQLAASRYSNYTFPDNFMFGVASAAFQIEGGWNAGGRGESVWDTYLHEHPDFTADNSNGDIAADSYNKYKQDVIMVESLGVKYYRLSISWSRILPRGTDNYVNKEGVNYYRSLFKELLKANITPVVTLFHFDLPTPFMDLGGWTNPVMVDYFEDYARIVFTLFGDLVKLWNTINEPHVYCLHGYGSDYFVPVLNFPGIADYLCSHYLLLGHSRVYHLYDKHFRPHQKGKIFLTCEAFYAEPKDKNNITDVEAAERVLQLRLGLYAHPVFSENGDYPETVRKRINELSIIQGYKRSRLPVFTQEEIKLLKGSSDFFGINHYTSALMSSCPMQENWPVPSIDHDLGVFMETDPSWPIYASDWLAVYPPGFRKLLSWITKNYGTKIPIIVTENGMSDYGGINDYNRVSYFNEYLEQLLLAIYEDGCNVIGYFAWSLMDDFEWRDGYSVKFGLFHVDFDSPERSRTPKLSAINFREIVRTKRINFDYLKRPE